MSDLLTPTEIAEARRKGHREFLLQGEHTLEHCEDWAIAKAQSAKSYEAGKKEAKRELVEWLERYMAILPLSKSGYCLLDKLSFREALRREVA